MIFTQINLVVADMDATIAFYRRLGLSVPDAEDWPAGSGQQHVEAALGDGVTLEFDTVAAARTWRDRPPAPGGGSAIIGFRLTSRDEVDSTYGALVSAGYEGRQAPFDAFFGSRYAVVADPDGHEVGLMSPARPHQAVRAHAAGLTASIPPVLLRTVPIW